MFVNRMSAGLIFGAGFSQRASPLSQDKRADADPRLADAARVKDALTDLRAELQNTLGTASPSSTTGRPIYVTRDLYLAQIVVGTQDFLVGFEEREAVEPSRIAKDEIAAVASSIAALQRGLDASPGQAGDAAGSPFSIELGGIVQGLDLKNLAATPSAAAIAQAKDQVERALAQTELLQMKLQKQRPATAITPASLAIDGRDDPLNPPQTGDAALALAQSVATRLRGIAEPIGPGSIAKKSLLSIKS